MDIEDNNFLLYVFQNVYCAIKFYRTINFFNKKVIFENIV